MPYAAVPVVRETRRDETEGRRMRPRRCGDSVPPRPKRLAPHQLARPSWPPGRSRLSPACGYAVDRSAGGSPLRTNHRRDLDPSARAWDWECDPLCLRARERDAALRCGARACWRSDCRIAKRPHNHSACSRKAIDYNVSSKRNTKHTAAGRSNRGINRKRKRTKSCFKNCQMSRECACLWASTSMLLCPPSSSTS